jgi:protein TonB
MLHTLLESNAARQRRRGSTAVSVAAHTLMIGGAIVATASAKPRRGETYTRGVDTLVYVWPERRPPQLAAPTTPGVSGQARGPETPPMPRWTIDLDPGGITRPQVDVDVARFFGADSIPSARVLSPRSGPGGEGLGEAGGEPTTVATVERPAAMIAPPRPRYPDQLRAAGVSGRVVVRLVVDTLGRVEPGSVVIRESSHDLFTHSVRSVLPSLRFTPAEVGGRRVRMLVDLPIEFRLNE